MPQEQESHAGSPRLANSLDHEIALSQRMYDQAILAARHINPTQEAGLEELIRDISPQLNAKTLAQLKENPKKILIIFGRTLRAHKDTRKKQLSGEKAYKIKSPTMKLEWGRTLAKAYGLHGRKYTLKEIAGEEGLSNEGNYKSKVLFARRELVQALQPYRPPVKLRK